MKIAYSDYTTKNPFTFECAVSPQQHIGREHEIGRIVSRIAHSGQSTTLVGPPRSGKTSVLTYLFALENRALLYGENADMFTFSYLNAQTLPVDCTRADFWERILQPLRATLESPNFPAQLVRAYQACVEEQYSNYTLRRLFQQMRSAKRRFVLLLDGFDDLLEHPILHSVGFFAGLRSFTLYSRGALALVIASRQPLSKYNEATQAINPTGSPYFNFLDEITLNPFSRGATNTLLAKGDPHFIRGDKTFIKGIAGGHPYLLQVVASALWDAYEDGEPDPLRRREIAGEKLYQHAANTLRDTWRLWSPAMRKAFMAVALDHDHTTALDDRTFDLTALLRDLHDYELELTSLKKQGYLVEDRDYPSGCRVHPSIFVRWCNDELRRAVRSKASFERWIQAQEWGTLLKRDERKQLENAGRALRDFVRDSGVLSGLGKVLFGGG